MLNVQKLQKLYFLLPFLYPQTERPDFSLDLERSTAWSYQDTETWGIDYPQCNGRRQSPIDVGSAYILPLLPNQFTNYDVPLAGNIILANNGHTVEFEVRATTNGVRPLFTGGIKRNTYQAINVHFHWGSQGVLGSEHAINGRRFDVEMHIVHRNVIYNTTEEANRNQNGLAVLGIFFMISDTPNNYPGLNKIFDLLPNVIEYESSAIIENPLTLNELLGDIDTKHFYTYAGSLTTPPCAESVSWIVYPEPLLISYEYIQRFWSIQDEEGNPLINNFRPLQARNNRPVFYRQ